MIKQQDIPARAKEIALIICSVSTEDRHLLYCNVANELQIEGQGFQASHFRLLNKLEITSVHIKKVGINERP